MDENKKGFYWLVSFLMFPYLILIAYPLKQIKEKGWTRNKVTDKKEFDNTYLIWLIPVGFLFAGLLLGGIYKYFGNSGKGWELFAYLLGGIVLLFILESILHNIYILRGKRETSLGSKRYSEKWVFKSLVAKSRAIATSRFMTSSEVNREFTKDKLTGYEIIKSLGHGKTHGFLISTKLDVTKNEMQFTHTKDDSHALIIGSTRSGKTSRLVNPQIQALSSSPEKPSMIISDVKGELFNFHAKILKDKGYKILSLNLLERGHTDFWNPLEKIWNDWQVGNPKEIEDMKLEAIRDNVQENIQDLTNSIVPPDKKDIWEEGARGILNFLILGMLEQAEVDENITLEKFNLSNLSYNLNKATPKNLVDNSILLSEIARERLIEDKLGSGTSRAIELGGRYVNMAEDTTTGVLGQLATKISSFASVKVRYITSKTTININDDVPTAIFVKVPHSKKTNWSFVSLFINEMYKELIESISRKRAKALARPMYFILDEFGNFPPLTQLGSMISIGAGHHMYFAFVVQALSQIVDVYDENMMKNLMSNVGYKYYLMSGDEDTKEYISRAMGEIETKTFSVSESKGKEDKKNESNSSSITKRRLMSAEELGSLKMGDVIILSLRNKPLKAKFDKFWEFKSFSKTQSDFEIVVNALRSRENDIDLTPEENKILKTSIGLFYLDQEKEKEPFDKKAHYYEWVLAEPE